jgi:hypothetical protein
MEPIRAFDSLALPGIKTRPDTSSDAGSLVRIEGVRGSNPLSSTEWSSRFCGGPFSRLGLTFRRLSVRGCGVAGGYCRVVRGRSSGGGFVRVGLGLRAGWRCLPVVVVVAVVSVCLEVGLG